MTTILVGVIVTVVLFFVVKSRIVTGAKVKMSDIPVIFDKLVATGKDANFAVLRSSLRSLRKPQTQYSVILSLSKDQFGLPFSEERN
jgi:hypothetical protein